MAYCRWSSDNWKCDLYCYEDVAVCWTTHVAANRRVGVENLPPDPMELIGTMSNDEWQKKYEEHRGMLKALTLEKITLPHAGETFHDRTLEEFRERLLNLREVGYHFPDHVLEAIDEELTDATAKEGNSG